MEIKNKETQHTTKASKMTAEDIFKALDVIAKKQKNISKLKKLGF